jgi:hypothetical protein
MREATVVSFSSAMLDQPRIDRAAAARDAAGTGGGCFLRSEVN